MLFKSPLLLFVLVLASCGTYEVEINDDIDRIKNAKHSAEYNGAFKEGLFYCIIANQKIIQIHEHSCCSGSGFDLNLIKINDSDIYRSDDNYCVGKVIIESIDKSMPMTDVDIINKLISMGFRKIN